MNELYKKIILVLAGGLVAISAFLVTTIQPKDVTPLGGGLSSYKATTTTATVASGSTVWLVKRGAGVLGSVVISSTTPDSLYIGEARFVIADSTYSTSTASTTPPISFPRTAAAGTYIFNQAFSAGISISVPANFNGVYTITYE